MNKKIKILKVIRENFKVSQKSKFNHHRLLSYIAVIDDIRGEMNDDLFAFRLNNDLSLLQLFLKWSEL